MNATLAPLAEAGATIGSFELTPDVLASNKTSKITDIPNEMTLMITGKDHLDSFFAGAVISSGAV